MVWPYGPTIKQTAIFVCGGFCNIDLLWCFKEKSIQSSTRNFLLKGVKEFSGGKKYYVLKVRKFKFNERPKQQFSTILQEYLRLLHLLIFYAPEAEEGILAFIFWRWQHSIYPFGEKYEFFMRQRLLQSRFEIAEPRISRPTQPKPVMSKKPINQPINPPINL